MKDLSDPGPQQRQPHLADAELAHAVSLSLKVRCSLFFFFKYSYWYIVCII